MLKNMSHRHNRAMRGQKAAPVLQTYTIVDPHHRPDLRGEFGGVKVERSDGKPVVRLTETAARFYLDSGAIALHEAHHSAPVSRK